MKNTVLTLVVLLLIAAGAYYLYKNNQTTMTEPVVEETVVEEEESTMTEEEPEVMTKTIVLAAVDPDVVDQSGEAVLTDTDAGLEVELTLTAIDATTPQPAHIHEGECPGVGAVAYALENVVNGKSTTVLDGVTLADLMDMLPLAINIHKSATESSVYTACGDIVL